MAAFVLVTSYNSLLISYVTSPNAEPLISSMTDLSNSSIKIVVDAGQAIDYILSVGFNHSHNYAYYSFLYYINGKNVY
jgi:glutamate receptor, ionotropic, invertebrate